jgi:hypothetical protein
MYMPTLKNVDFQWFAKAFRAIHARTFEGVRAILAHLHPSTLAPSPLFLVTFSPFPATNATI